MEQGYGYHFAPVILAAKMTMRRGDLPGFLHQPTMGPAELPGRGGFPEVREALSRHGIRVSGTPRAEFRRFDNGSPTWLLIDTQRTEEAIVYVYMDEP